MVNVNELGEPFKVDRDGEPWEWYSETKWFDISHTTLGDMVLVRLALTEEAEDLKVEVLDVRGSTGTCEICGGYNDGLEIRVGGATVWAADDYYGYENDNPGESSGSVYAKLDEWLKEDING